MPDSAARPLPEWQLDSRHSADVLRLIKRLTQHHGFRFIPVVFNDPLYRDRLITHIADCLDKNTEQVNLSAWTQCFDALLSHLKQLTAGHAVIHLTHYEDSQTYCNCRAGKSA